MNVYDVRVTTQAQEQIRDIEGVKDITLIQYNGEYNG